MSGHTVYDPEVMDESQHSAPESAMVKVAQTRVMQEEQAAMVIAKKFPRDQNAAFARIMQACQRKSLAEQATYAYPRGGETVTGPSIRLAEAMAQNWGNLDFGIVEVEQRDGESVVLAYARDLETNVRQTKIFTVPHARYTKKGITRLKDPRDIYEMVANQGARRLRACILGVIPGDIQDAAIDACEKTLASGSNEPLIDRVRKMVSVFNSMGVSVEMLEKRLGHKLDVTTEHELVKMRAIHKSIVDNMQSVDSFFERGTEAPINATIDPASLKPGKPPEPKPSAADAAKASTPNPTAPSPSAPPANNGTGHGNSPATSAPATTSATATAEPEPEADDLPPKTGIVIKYIGKAAHKKVVADMDEGELQEALALAQANVAQGVKVSHNKGVVNLIHAEIAERAKG